MFQVNMLLLSLLIGTLRPFGFIFAQAEVIDLTKIVQAALDNAEKIGVGFGFLMLVVLLYRKQTSDDTARRDETEIDKKQLELIQQGLTVGTGVTQVVDKLDGAVGALAKIGSNMSSTSEKHGEFMDKMSALVDRMDAREAAYTDALKKTASDTYMGITNIMQLIETLPTRLSLPTNVSMPDVVQVKRGILIGDAEGKVISVNEYALQMLHLKREDVLGKAFFEVGQVTVDPVQLTIATKEERPSYRIMSDKLTLTDFFFGFFNEEDEQFDWFLLDGYPRLLGDKLTGIMLKFISVGELLSFVNTGSTIINDITIKT